MSFWRRLFGAADARLSPPRGTRTVTATIVDGPGTFDVEAVGESNYQDILWRAVREHAPAGRRYRVPVVAVLLPEPSNPYDRNAIRVLINGETAGYLSREDAIEYQEFIVARTHDDRAAGCNAFIYGGSISGERRGSLGIWLDLPDPKHPDMPRHGTPKTTGASAAAFRGDRTQHALYKGKYYTEYVEDVKALKRHDALDEALDLLGFLLDAVEEEATSDGTGVAPWYYEQTAIVYRKKRDFAGEVAVLERFAAQPHAPGSSPPVLFERLQKARERLAKESPSNPS
jgi:hypothetical protein